MLPVCNNNGAQALNANANFLPILAPTPAVAFQPPVGQQQSCYMLDVGSYYFAGGSTGVGTVITFQELGLDGTWRPLVSPAPITVANSTNANGVINGPAHGWRVVISNNTGNGVAYGELKATIRGGV